MSGSRHGSGSASAEESEPLTGLGSTHNTPRQSLDDGSVTSTSTTSLVLESLHTHPLVARKPKEEFEYRDNPDDVDVEISGYLGVERGKSMTKVLRRIIWVLSVIGLAGWAIALVLFLIGGRYKHPSGVPYDHETPSLGAGKKITLDQVLSAQWRPAHHDMQWIEGPDGEDGLLLEMNQSGQDFLVVVDVRSRQGHADAAASRTLMKIGWFQTGGAQYWTDDAWPSSDLKKVLILSKRERNWRHSFTGNYFIFDVETQIAEPLDPGNPDVRTQLASWAPTGDYIVFTRENNLFLRVLSSTAVRQLTTDGGPEYFYGIPDWVYEEEVFAGNSATWWDLEGQYIAFLRTNETMVPSYPVQYFLSRPSGKKPLPGEEAYPEIRKIKYPKAGAPNPVVDLMYYDVTRDEVFSVAIAGQFEGDDRIVYEVFWGNDGKIICRQSNRESDIMKVILVDVKSRTGDVLRTQDLGKLDGGWLEPRQMSWYIPSDPFNGRPQEGYVEQMVADFGDHLAYFTPLDNPEPIMLTSGQWEVINSPSTIDLKNNIVYFVSTKDGSTSRHVYSVTLNGTDLKALTDTSKPGYYEPLFSALGGYQLLSYRGPSIPWQKVLSTPSNPETYNDTIEENPALAEMARTHEMPHEVYSTVTIDNFTLNVVERRPPFFDEDSTYPVLFHLYGGPGSQTVDRTFNIDFQSYIASSLGYIVVTVDGRGTGFIGRAARTCVRSQLGLLEAHDQIETAKIWARKPYVDPTRMAIWGWSYGGFMTLKVLELDAGQTFRYGMAVAPVTDWRFYDSVYTERYMRTPQANPAGYAVSAITNVTALAQNVRWLMMHGVADDNVHFQSTLVVLDKLDLAGVENYDVHFFPDSDHSIFFHNANRVVYDKLSWWLRKAFEGVWEEIA